MSKKIEKTRKVLTGRVVSTKCAKTAHVVVERVTKHPKYGKTVRISRKYAVHDPDGICVDGSFVTITESRPISKTKRWAVVPKGVEA